MKVLAKLLALAALLAAPAQVPALSLDGAEGSIPGKSRPNWRVMGFEPIARAPLSSAITSFTLLFAFVVIQGLPATATLRLQGPHRLPPPAAGLPEPARSAVLESGRLRIINGNCADDDDRRFAYFALITMDSSAMCGGSLISDKFVLTAGQCVAGYLRFQVMMGNTNRVQASATYEYQFTDKFVVHEDFQEDTALNDIGLVQLLFPVKFSVGIKPVRLPSAADATRNFENQVGTVSGYGSNDFGFNSHHLRYVRQTVMTNARCKRFFYGTAIHDSLLCGDGEGRLGICTIDVGGPLVLEDEEGGWTQIGVASFESSMGCDLGYPSVYTRLTAHLDWVRGKAGLAA